MGSSLRYAPNYVFQLRKYEPLRHRPLINLLFSENNRIRTDSAYNYKELDKGSLNKKTEWKSVLLFTRYINLNPIQGKIRKIVVALQQRKLGRKEWGRCRSKNWAGQNRGAAAAKTWLEKVGAFRNRKLGGKKWGRCRNIKRTRRELGRCRNRKLGTRK